MEMQTRENSTQELKNENVEKEERILTKRDVTKYTYDRCCWHTFAALQAKAGWYCNPEEQYV